MASLSRILDMRLPQAWRRFKTAARRTSDEIVSHLFSPNSESPSKNDYILWKFLLQRNIGKSQFWVKVFSVFVGDADFAVNTAAAFRLQSREHAGKETFTQSEALLQK